MSNVNFVVENLKPSLHENKKSVVRLANAQVQWTLYRC